MKVTKLIREYVEEQVSKVYDAKVNPYSEQAELDKKKIEAFKEELKAQQIETITRFMSENELFEEHYRSGFTPFEISTSIPSFYHVKTKAMVDESKWAEENRRNKKAKIRDIILALELGANRQELNDMIAALLKED